jgi:hypothetical protein
VLAHTLIALGDLEMRTARSARESEARPRKTDYDSLVAALRERAAAIGLSFAQIDELANLAESGTAKYLSDLRVKTLGLQTFFAITETLGIRAIFVEDERLLEQMRPHWRRRDEGKAHRASPLAKRLGQATIARVLPVIARELGRRGGLRRRELPAAERVRLARMAARARWQNRRSAGCGFRGRPHIAKRAVQARGAPGAPGRRERSARPSAILVLRRLFGTGSAARIAEGGMGAGARR